MSDEHLCRTGDANHFCVCSMGRDHDSMLCRSDDERLPRPVSASPVDTKSADPLPHDWYEITEDDRSVFCDRCDICKCHGGELVDLPCPGEPTGPEFGFTEGNDK